MYPHVSDEYGGGLPKLLIKERFDLFCFNRELAASVHPAQYQKSYSDIDTD